MMSSSPNQGETFHAVDNPRVASSERDPVVRTLKEPPDIWDMVHETHTEFRPGSAFIGRLTSSLLWLAAILLIIAAGAVFWFVMSRGSSMSKTAVTTVPAESRDIKSLKSAPADTTVSSPAQEQISTPTGTRNSNPATATAASSQPAPESSTASSSKAEPANTLARPVKSTDLKNNQAAQATSSRTPSGEKPRQQNLPSAGMFSDANLSGKDKQDAAKASSSKTARGEVVGLTGNKDGTQTSAASGPKSDNQKPGSPAATKKDSDKAPGPQLITPAKANSTPKAKVIPWP